MNKLSDEDIKSAYLTGAFASADDWTVVGKYVTEFAHAIIAAHEAQRQAGQEPLFWVRLRSDGGYEGPIHSASIEDVRKKSGAWTALFAAPQPAPVPEGYKLVPIEPTEEMHKTGAEMFGAALHSAAGFDHHARCVYRAMLAAAPDCPR